MKIYPDCIPCLLSRVLYETNLVNPKLADKTIKNALKILAKEYSKNVNSAEIATLIHRKTYKILKNNDPYKKLKKKSNKIAFELLPKVEKIIENSEDKFKTAILCSIIGNVLDFGIKTKFSSPEQLKNEFDSLFKEGLYVDDVEKIKEYLEKLKRPKILYFADNVGEIVFDKLLCKELKKFNAEIIFVVKGRPIITDAILKDAKEIKIEKVVEKVLTTNTNAVGINFREISKELKKELKNSNLIICKGMALYECFSEKKIKNIVYLLRIKCSAIAKDLKLPKDVNVAKFVY